MKAEPSGAGVQLHGTPAPFSARREGDAFSGRKSFNHSFTHYFILNSHFGPIIPNIDKENSHLGVPAPPIKKKEEDGTYVVWEQGKEN